MAVRRMVVGMLSGMPEAADVDRNDGDRNDAEPADTDRNDAGPMGADLSSADGDAAGPSDAAEAVRNAHAWFELNSGWAPPDEDTLAEWVADGVCRCPDECLVAPDAWCQHGLASWALVLAALAEADARSPRPGRPGEPGGPDGPGDPGGPDGRADAAGRRQGPQRPEGRRAPERGPVRRATHSASASKGTRR